MSSHLPQSTFEANLAALEALLPAERCAELRMAPEAIELEVVETPSGMPTCRAFGLWIYSRHDPAGEARRLVEREIPRSTEICVFENLGLGYHVEALLDALPETRAVVIEPDLRWFRTAMGARDLTRILCSSRVTLLVDASVELLPAVLGEAVSVHVVRLRALSKKNSDYFRLLSEEMQGMLSRREINKNTIARFGRRWVRNLIRNIELIPRSRDVQELAGSFSSLPCLLLAAGPSLDLVLPHLSALRERFLLLSVDTSFRAALACGIVPDFLVVVDPQYWNARHLDGCPMDSTILVSESSTYPAIFHRPLGPLFFCGSLFPLGQFLEARTGSRGKLGAGGSVSTTTWDFARLLGCSSIVCAGLDLGFPQLKTHFRGGFFEERLHLLSGHLHPAEGAAFHLLRDADPYPVRSNSNGSTLTDRRLVVYKWWFENQLDIHPGAITYNLSPDGVRIEGMAAVDVQRLLTYPVIRDEIDGRIAAVRNAARASARRATPASITAAISELLGELEELRGSALDGLRSLEELRRLLQVGEDPAAQLAKLQEVDATIASLATREIAGFLMHSTAQSILEGNRSGDEQERVIDDSRELYAGLDEAARYHMELLRGAKERLHARSRNSTTARRRFTK